MTKHDQPTVTRPNSQRTEHDRVQESSGDGVDRTVQPQGDGNPKEPWSPGRVIEQPEGTDEDRRELPGSQDAPEAPRTDGPRGLDWQGQREPRR